MSFDFFNGTPEMVIWVKEELDPFVEKWITAVSQPHVLLDYVADYQKKYARRLHLATESLDYSAGIPIDWKNGSLIARPLSDNDLQILGQLGLLLKEKFNSKPSPLWTPDQSRKSSQKEKGIVYTASLYMSANRDFFLKK